MQYIFDYHDGYICGNADDQYLDITNRKHHDIEYLKQFYGEFFFFSQDTFFQWSTYWSEEKISLEHLDKILATRIYRQKNGTWREITRYFDREIQRGLEEIIARKNREQSQENEYQEKLRRARLPSGMMRSQVNLTSAPQIPNYICRRCYGKKEIQDRLECINEAKCGEIDWEICDKLCGVNMCCPNCNGTGKITNPEYDIYGEKLIK